MRVIHSTFALCLLFGCLTGFAQTTINDIDQSSGWFQPGTSTPNFCTGTACAGGSSDANLSWMAQNVTTVQQDGKSQEFHVGGNAGGYGNARWWAVFPPESNATSFNFAFHINTDQNSFDVAQALQFGVEQMFANGNHYKMEVQCDYNGGSGKWRFFDPRAGWIVSNRACVKFANGWNDFSFQFQRVPCPSGLSSPTGECAQWTNMNINGTDYPITKPDGSGMYAVGSTNAGSNQLQVVVQLDGNSAENPYEVYLDGETLTTNGTPDAGGGGGGGGSGPSDACTGQFCDTDDPGHTWNGCPQSNPACANSGATGVVANANFTQGISAEGRADVVKYDISGTCSSCASNWFADAYRWHSNTTALSAPVSQAVDDFDINVPAAFVDTPQAIEFELQQSSGGITYNMGWQFLYAGQAAGTMRLRTFDYVNKAWVDTGIAIARFAGDTWYHVKAHYTISGSNILFDWIEVTPLGASSVNHYVPSGAGAMHQSKQTGHAPEFNNAFQLDMHTSSSDVHTGAAYFIYLDKAHVSYTP